MKQNREKNSLAYYNGAIVEVLENRGYNTVIKIKGGSRASVLTRNLQPTEEKKTRLPEWLAVGSRVYHNGKIKTLTRVGNTRYEAEGVGCWYDGQIAGLLADGRPVCDSDTITEEPHQALADLQRLLAASVEDLNLDTADLLQLQFLAASVGFDELAMYIHGLQCTNTEPNLDELREIAENMLWSLQGEIEEYEEEADDMRNDLESARAAGYDKYLDYRADPSNKAAIEEAKAEFNEVIAERIKDINEQYTLYIEPAAARLRSFLAAFSAVVPQPEDPAQCTMIFEAEEAPAADTPASEKTEPTPASEKTAATDADVLEQAERIRASYEALKAEAEREQSAAAFAEAITAYCEELEQPEPLAWEPETIIIPFEPRPAAEVEQPRRRHRLNLRPRLSRWLHPARWVSVAFVVCLLSGLLLGMNTSTAAADDIAAAYELAPVNVTAEAPDTFIEDKAPCLIEDKAPCLIEDKAPAPSPVKKLAAPSPVKNVAEAAECSSQKTDAADSPAGEKTASPMNTASDPHGLTICAGTAWAYTMMNWA
jgi:hypothetical protein